MTPKVSRHELLAAGGAIGAMAAARGLAPQAQAGHVELGRFVKRAGVQGKMTGRRPSPPRWPARACAASSASRAPRTTSSGTRSRRAGSLHARGPRGVGERHGRCLGSRHRRAVGVFAVVPGPGLTNAMTGIGEALVDSIPIVGIITDIDRSPKAPIGQVHGLANAAIVRPVVKAVIEVRHQAEIPGAIFQAFRMARAGEPGPVAVLIPFPFYAEVWDYDQPVPPPYPVPFDEAAYGRALAHLGDRRRRVGIYAGLGCVEAGPALAAVAELLQAPVATSVSGKGCIPDCAPAGRRLGLWQAGDAGRRGGLQGRGPRAGGRGPLQRGLDGQLRHPAARQLIHVDINPDNLGRNVPTHVCVCCRCPRVPRPAARSTATRSAARPAPRSGRRSRKAGGRSIGARP